MIMNPLVTAQQVGHLLVARRKILGLSQADMAQRLGISQSRYSEIETAPERITLERLLVIAAALGFEVALQERPASPLSSEW